MSIKKKLFKENYGRRLGKERTHGNIFTENLYVSYTSRTCYCDFGVKQC